LVVLLCATKFLAVYRLVLVALNKPLPRLLHPHLPQLPLTPLPAVVPPLVVAAVVLVLPNPNKLVNP
jgi:hypothetical protein